MDQQVPEVVFNPERAFPIFPRPDLKNAVLVPIPLTEDGSEIPTFIKPNWGGVQVFYGDYYAIIKNGCVDYGSAKGQWEAMHINIRPGYWAKKAIPMAYPATERCKIVTLIPTADGGVREAVKTLEVGDLIVKQPGGELQHINADKFPEIYFSDHEARERGLYEMTPGQFAAWVIDQVRESIPSV